MRALSRRFFERDAVAVARDLLGRLLVKHEPDGRRLVSRIVETEAYAGPGDRAAHVAGGRRTARTEVFWGPGGHAYVYLIYGMHHCFNVVTEPAGTPSAVLVRAARPLEGMEVMVARRGKTPDAKATGSSLITLTSGPGRLAAAYGLTRADTGLDVTKPPLFIAAGRPVPDAMVLAAPRIGVDYAGEDALLPYRFVVRGDPFVSKPWPPGHMAA
jgi:DNA-3-methyladenine glycosylase